MTLPDPAEVIRRNERLSRQSALGAFVPPDVRIARRERLEAEQEQRAAAGALEKAVKAYRRWLHLPDPGVLYAALGAAAANLMPGDPVWLLLVGPPGCGKTETIAPLGGLPYVHPAAVVTPPALLSGTSRREQENGATGGLLHQVGELGILLIKDFTSVLAQHREARAEALAALREVYDGRYDRPVGTGGGRVLSWQGKCGLIGGCTPTIDRHHAVMAAMGERFCLYRLDVDDPAEQARRRIKNFRHESQMRSELAAAAARVLEPLQDCKPAPLDDAEIENIVAWARFAVWARTGVERDGYSHDVLLMPSIEAPARLAGTLRAMHAALAAIGVPVDQQWRIVTKLAWDCIPDLRRRLLEHLHRATGALYTADLVALTGIPKTTAERTLEDLALVGLLERTKAAEHSTAAWQWRLSCESAGLWPAASPETSEGR